jgi:hypothetical protein
MTGITDDESKATALLNCLDKEYLLRVENATMNLSLTGQYERLKEKLLRILAETDRDKVTRLVENEVMGDRKPSQFYHDLKKLVSPRALEEQATSSNSASCVCGRQLERGETNPGRG